MKYIYILLFVINANIINAQVDLTVAKDVKNHADTSTNIKQGWTRGASLNVNFNQTKLTNWFAGGDRLSLGLNTMLKANTTYKKNKNLFKANIEAAYGMIKTTSSGGMRKTDDRWVLTSSYNRRAAKSLYITLAAQVKSQFERGYTYTETGSKTLISDFLSPGDIKLGLGMTYQPSKNFSAYLSPVTAKINVKKSNALYSQKIFGVDSFKRYALDL
ncbi:MAG: DUF3078 domain-containing protein, partial [Bacteroidetes bacterium]|nr:DUF3078 domain-containing protein [Bacteroidota bacterium]